MKIQEMIKRAKQGDKDAKEEIIKKYMPLVIKNSFNIFISGYDMEDLKQLGYISILKAIDKFDLDKNKDFTAYVKQSIIKNYYYEIRKKARLGAESSINKTTEEGIEFEDMLESDCNIEEDFICKEDKMRLKKALRHLSKEEMEFINIMYGKGYGGITEYSKIKKVKYAESLKMRDRVLKKLRTYMGEE